MKRKKYIPPETVRECILEWEQPFCGSDGKLDPLTESGDLGNLDWDYGD